MRGNSKWLLFFVLLALSYTGAVFLLYAQDTSAQMTIVSDTDTDYLRGSAWTPAALAWVTDEWPSIENARWIWCSEFVTTEEAQNGTPLITFRRHFTLPTDARTISGTIQITADNAYELLLNGVVIGADGVLDPAHTDLSWTTVEHYSFPAQPGDNELLVRALGYHDTFGRNDPALNPAGLLFFAELTYYANQPPVAVDQQVTVVQETTTGITLTATDGDGDPLTYRVIDEPIYGTLQGTAPALLYTAQAGFTGDDHFTFQANDGIATSNLATVNMTVLARPGRIIGQVLWQKQPLANAKVTVGGVDYPVDPNGEFRVDAVAEGHYEVVAQALLDEKPHATRSEVTVMQGATTKVNLIVQQFPDAFRLLHIDGVQSIHGARMESFPLAETVAITPDARQQDIHSEHCIDDSVRLELNVQCQLNDDNASVGVIGEARLYLGTSCRTTARKATAVFSVDLAIEEASTKNMHLEYSGPEGAASADLRIDLVNGRQMQSTVAPATRQAGGSLVSPTKLVHLIVPQQAVTDPVTLRMAQAPVPQQLPPTRPTRRLNSVWDVTAQSTTGEDVTSVTRAYTMTIQYSDGHLQGQGIDETTLGLLFWNGTRWVEVLPCAGCGVDPVNNRLTAVLDHFTTFALVGTVIETEQELYLPIIFQSIAE